MGLHGAMSKLLFWNCRGLGNPKAIRSLTDLARQNSLDIFFLSETQRWDLEMKRIKQRFDFSNGVWVNAFGRANG